MEQGKTWHLQFWLTGTMPQGAQAIQYLQEQEDQEKAPMQSLKSRELH